MFPSTLYAQTQCLVALNQGRRAKPRAGGHVAVSNCFVGRIQWHNSALKQMVLIIFI